MERLRNKLHDPAFTTRFHKWATLTCLWVALMSIWANVASHWAAYQASRAEQHNN